MTEWLFFSLGKIIFKSRMRFPSVIVTRELRYIKVLCRIFLETLTLFMLVNFNCFMRTGYKLPLLPDFFFEWSIQMYSHFYGNLFSQQCIMTRNYLFRERQSVFLLKDQIAIHLKEWNYNLNWTIIMCMMFLAFLL